MGKPVLIVSDSSSGTITIDEVIAKSHVRCILSLLDESIAPGRNISIREWENILHKPHECFDCKKKLEAIRRQHGKA